MANSSHTDDDRDEQKPDRRMMSVKVKCPDSECEATHVRPEWIDPDDPPETIDATCIPAHPARDAGFEGCGEDRELTVVDVSELET